MALDCVLISTDPVISCNGSTGGYLIKYHINVCVSLDVDFRKAF